MMESGAIMMYLADKYKKFQCDGDEYWRMVEWLMWQMGGLGPMLGETESTCTLGIRETGWSPTFLKFIYRSGPSRLE